MPKKKKENDLTPDEQFRRFKEAVRKAEIDQHAPDPLDRAFNSIIRPAQRIEQKDTE